jgi:hypothetical protein
MSKTFRIPDASVRIDSMPAAGRDIEVKVEPADRNAVADELGITAVEKLEARLHVVRFKGGIRVTGRLIAMTVQPSVISLEPVKQDISEPIDRIFLPGSAKPFADSADAEIFVDLEGDDMPDHFEGNEADLTDLIVETVALALDPYPRLPDESLGEIGDDGDTGSDLPFAGLRVLKGDKE